MIVLLALASSSNIPLASWTMIKWDCMENFQLMFIRLRNQQGIIKQFLSCWYWLKSIEFFSLSSSVYVSEHRIERGQHSVYFNCELFTDRYQEYCFVYTTESKSGAVANIREDCVPTSPIDGMKLRQIYMSQQIFNVVWLIKLSTVVSFAKNINSFYFFSDTTFKHK